jgi:Ca2+-binding EF-hand superfamily protein
MKHWLLTCGLMVAMSAFAEPGTPKGPKALAALDTDGDKMISLAEAQQGSPQLAARFNELDTNKDGLLSTEEVLEGRPMRGVRFTRNIQDDFAAADGNADGKLSRSEAEAMPIMSDFFDEIDANADGYITMDEIHQHAKTRGPIFVVKEPGVEVGTQR